VYFQSNLSQAARIAAWSLATAIVVLSVIPPDLRPETAVPHNFEHFLIYSAAGLAFGLGYERKPGLLAVLLLIFTGAVEFAQLFRAGAARTSERFHDRCRRGVDRPLVGISLYRHMHGKAHSSTILFEETDRERLAHTIEIMRAAGRDICDGFEIGGKEDRLRHRALVLVAGAVLPAAGRRRRLVDSSGEPWNRRPDEPKPRNQLLPQRVCGRDPANVPVRATLRRRSSLVPQPGRVNESASCC
jgi:hypothetical protein